MRDNRDTAFLDRLRTYGRGQPLFSDELHKSLQVDIGMSAADYAGARPSASNWRSHSVERSRSCSTPMPRGSRPSMAALTNIGDSKASDSVRDR